MAQIGLRTAGRVWVGRNVALAALTLLFGELAVASASTVVGVASDPASASVVLDAARGAEMTVTEPASSVSPTPLILAATTFGGGIGGPVRCRDLAHEITRNWFDVKTMFRKKASGVRRPRANSLQCVSPEVVYDMHPVNSTPSLNLACFRRDDAIVCCDKDLRACVYIPEGGPQT